MNAVDALSRFASVRVLVVGDLMLDEYIWGDVTRISPEAPVPVVEVKRRSFVPGGAANAAAGVVALGGKAALVGVVGDDEAGGTLRRELDDRGIDVGGLVVAEGRPTTTKTRVIAQSQQVVRADVEDVELASQLEDQLVRAAAAGVDDADVVLVSDYGKGVVSKGVAEAAIGRATELGRPVVVDPKGGDYGKYRGATVVTPNVHETELATRLQIASGDDLDRAAAELARALDAAVLVTRGPEGMSLFRDGAGRVDIEATSRAVYDVTGAGDTVVSVLALSLAGGLALEEAALLANLAAGIVVGKVGTATVEPDELAAAASSDTHA